MYSDDKQLSQEKNAYLKNPTLTYTHSPILFKQILVVFVIVVLKQRQRNPRCGIVKYRDDLTWS